MWRPLIVFGRATWLAAVLCVLPSAGADAKRRSARATATVPEAPAFREASLEADPDPASGPTPAQILSPTELLSLARKHALDLASTMIDGERIREAAAREQDLIRLSCLQEHLLQMKLVKRVADDSLEVLGRRDIRADELRLRHEFRSVEMGLEQVTRLRDEMAECAGADTRAEDGGNGPQSAARPTDVIDPTTLPADRMQPERPAAASPAI